MIFREIDTIFIHIAKAGGTTITYDILKSIRGNSVRDIVGVYDDPNMSGTNRGINKAHVSASDIKRFMGKKYDDFYSFAIIRSPFEQIASLFSQLSYMNIKVNPRFEPYKTMTFEKFILSKDRFSMVGKRQKRLIDQVGMVSDKGEIIVKELFPYNHYRSAIKVLSRKGIPVKGKIRLRETQDEHLYSAKMIQTVMDTFGDSYELYEKVKKEFEDKYIK